ncbi:YhcN/YlaJ family sporulation lipoprotein [Bacillus tianshenii]|nr:YhcN/YlaJ family sporulation lipoprotein [Bacillus tianshenii]
MFRIILLITLLTLSACQMNNNEAELENNNQTDPLLVGTNDEQKVEKSANAIAKHLVSLASSVPNVKDATAVVAGQYAVVGIDVDKDLDRSRVGSIKYSVAEALQHDPYGARAIVIADADTYERLKDLRNKAQQGQPINAVAEELGAIVGRVIPQIPSDLRPATPAKDENKQQMEQNDDEQLDKEQQKQAKETEK